MIEKYVQTEYMKKYIAKHNIKPLKGLSKIVSQMQKLGYTALLEIDYDEGQYEIVNSRNVNQAVQEIDMSTINFCILQDNGKCHWCAWMSVIPSNGEEWLCDYGTGNPHLGGIIDGVYV